MFVHFHQHERMGGSGFGRSSLLLFGAKMTPSRAPGVSFRRQIVGSALLLATVDSDGYPNSSGLGDGRRCYCSQSALSCL